VIARGAEALGLAHGPLRRNAPDCDGQGVCCFGCPTGATRSTDVSYVPLALERGAALFTSARADKIVVEHGTATGVVARCRGGGKLVIKAKMVAVAGGTLMTPLILGGSGLANSSGMLGRNLSIHPAAKVMALMEEPVEMWQGIPQSYAIEHFAEEGLMFEGSSTPFDVTSVALSFSGPLFSEVMENYAKLASFGFMIQDTSRGSVRRGVGGRPLITYSLNRRDVARMQRGIDTLTEVFWAAGARRIFPAVHGFDELRTRGDIEALKRHRLRAGDLELTAYHPLGTARMGSDPRTSVVGPDHQTHDVRGLYVVDGAAVPSALGVNPQMTIMALATRAAEIMDRRLGASEQHAVPAPPVPQATPLGVSP
jgi:choline dehydrogenase-like flavoprotein